MALEKREGIRSVFIFPYISHCTIYMCVYIYIYIYIYRLCLKCLKCTPTCVYSYVIHDRVAMEIRGSTSVVMGRFRF